MTSLQPTLNPVHRSQAAGLLGYGQTVERTGLGHAGRPGAYWWEVALVSLWVYVTFVPFPGDELFLYPLALYFAGMFALRLPLSGPVILRAWPLLLIPTIAVSSAVWATAPNAALRFGVLLFLTVVIALQIASRLQPRQLVLAIFLAGTVLVFNLAPGFLATEDLGPFPEKNGFANRFLFICLAAFAVLYDRQQRMFLRLLALPVGLVSLQVLLTAKAVTAMILGVSGVLVLTIVWLIWTRAAQVRHLRSLFVMSGLIVLLLGAFAFINAPNNTLVQDTLDEFGKDATLTGRTVLWDTADRLSAERPILGVGAEGFWRPGNGEAETLVEAFHKKAGTKFNFHSTYWEIRVHLGLLGVALYFVMLAWCLWSMVFGWIRRQDIAHSFLLLTGAIAFIKSLTESSLYGVFSLDVITFYVAAAAPIVARLWEEQSRATQSALA